MSERNEHRQIAPFDGAETEVEEEQKEGLRVPTRGEMAHTKCASLIADQSVESHIHE